jgi:hypothetical protein
VSTKAVQDPPPVRAFYLANASGGGPVNLVLLGVSTRVEAKTLSSAQTLFMKIIFPALWISGFGVGTLALWLGVMHGKNNAPPPDGMKWQFLVIWIVGTAFILWGCSGLKRVRIDKNRLYVSNYIREIHVPLSDVRDVTEVRWINIHPVTVYFRDTTEFGDKIKFMPKVRFLLSWSSHPIVGELKSLARAQGARIGDTHDA